MAIGLKYGHYNEDTLLKEKDLMMEKTAEFKTKFYEKFASCNCKALLGYDVSIPEELQEAIDSGHMMEYCPTVVMSVIEILKTII